MELLDRIRSVQGRVESPARSGSRADFSRVGSGLSADQPASAPSSEDQAQSQTAAAGDRTPARIPAGGFYISPNLAFDARASTLIFQIRDAVSGDVTRQFPAEAAVERYRRDPSQQPFVLPEPDSADETSEPRINNRDTPDPAEIELATGPSTRPEDQEPASVGGAASTSSERASGLGAPSVSSQTAPVDIFT